MELLQRIKQEFKTRSSANVVESTRKFVPTATKIYGLTMPMLNEMARQYKEGGFVLVQKLWKSGAYEEQLLAAKILNKIAKKDPDLTLSLVADFASDINNWAVCDALGMQSIKPITMIRQQAIVKLSAKISDSPDPWQRRLSLVLLESYTKDPTLTSHIEKAIKKLEGDDAYYVRKAVDWLKRNYQKKR
jgi:3-methyladenine DNA glycosylase AlkD